MIALLAAIVLSVSPVQSQECGAYGQAGPNVGRVYWIGGPSADLSYIGAGACTDTAWFGSHELHVWRETILDPRTGRTHLDLHRDRE